MPSSRNARAQSCSQWAALLVSTFLVGFPFFFSSCSLLDMRRLLGVLQLPCFSRRKQIPLIKDSILASTDTFSVPCRRVANHRNSRDTHGLGLQSIGTPLAWTKHSIAGGTGVAIRTTFSVGLLFRPVLFVLPLLAVDTAELWCCSSSAQEPRGGKKVPATTLLSAFDSRIA